MTIIPTSFYGLLLAIFYGLAFATGSIPLGVNGVAADVL